MPAPFRSARPEKSQSWKYRPNIHLPLILRQRCIAMLAPTVVKGETMRRISQIFTLAVLLCLQAAAADLPAWTDDSSVVLRSDLQRFVAGQQQAKLTGAVFHPIDGATDAQFTFTVQNAEGSAVRVFQGARTFQPGQPMEFSVTWDGRDDSGMLLPNAKYIVEETVELKPSSLAIVQPATQASTT